MSQFYEWVLYKTCQPTRDPPQQLWGVIRCYWYYVDTVVTPHSQSDLKLPTANFNHHVKLPCEEQTATAHYDGYDYNGWHNGTYVGLPRFASTFALNNKYPERVKDISLALNWHGIEYLLVAAEKTRWEWRCEKNIMSEDLSIKYRRWL